ncbi:MAG: AAA domain-containing protein, partial [Chloroflexia bacterium]
LEHDLKNVLARAAAPPLVQPASRLSGVPPRSVLWHEYTRLNQALEELDECTLRAMPAHEREARFKSAHLLERLEGEDKLEAYDRLQMTVQQRLASAEELLIYRLGRDSYDFNVRPPALGYALAPRSDPAFLGKSAYPLVSEHEIKVSGRLSGSVAEAGLTKVSVVALDRVNGLIALKLWHTNCALELESKGVADFRSDVMVDPVGEDYLSSKLRLTLRGIGRPASAGEDESAAHALGLAGAAGSLSGVDETAPTPESPASEFLWQAPRLANTPVARDVAPVRARLEACGEHLNASQWAAWEAALTRRLALIWGPPGTGKSQTLRAIVAAAVWHAHREQMPLRLLISSNNYTAIDNVLLGIDTLLARVLDVKAYRLFRLQSQYNDPPAELLQHPDIEPVIVKTTQAPEDIQDLQAMLDTPSRIVVVAGPPQQLHNLAISTRNKTKKATPERTQRRWFDLVIIDEASQLDVAEATLVVSKAAEGAAFVLAGDDKQLPPIQPATPPEALEHVVGSVYNYIRHHHQVDPHPLQVNYRSCRTLVNFTRRAGYDPGLRAYHEDLRLGLLAPGLSCESYGPPPTINMGREEAFGAHPQAPGRETPAPHLVGRGAIGGHPQAAGREGPAPLFAVERPDNWPETLYWTPNWGRFLDPQRPAACFIYEDDVAGQSNPFEADSVA